MEHRAAGNGREHARLEEKLAMENVATDRTPGMKAVVPYFVGGAASLLIAMALLLLKAADVGAVHYFSPQILSITHIVALGWATMVIMGSLHQFVPVVFNVKLFSENLAVAAFVLLVCGLAHMAVAFWQFDFGWLMIVGSALAFASLIVFSLNIFFSLRGFKKLSQEAICTLASLVWLIITGAVGFILALNLHSNFIPGDHLTFLKMHAHFGALGWLLLMVIGVGTKLMPMFSLSHIEKDKMLKLVLALINFGLITLVAAMFLKASRFVVFACAIILSAGILRYIYFIFKTYRARIREKLDAGMQHSYSGFVLLLFPVLIGLIIPFLKDNELNLRLSAAYAFSYFFGLITVLILGQTYKMLPFIVWLGRYRSKIGRERTCLPRDLFKEDVAKWEFRLYIAGFLLFLTGIFFEFTFLKTIGATALFAAAMMYNYNVISIVFLKPDFPPVKESAKPFEFALPVVQKKN
jgi:hypothetical protein